MSPIGPINSKAFSIPVPRAFLPDHAEKKSVAAKPVSNVSTTLDASQSEATPPVHVKDLTNIVSSHSNSIPAPLSAVASNPDQSSQVTFESEPVTPQSNSTPIPTPLSAVASSSDQFSQFTSESELASVSSNAVPSAACGGDSTVHSLSAESEGIWEGFGRDTGEVPVYILQRIIVDSKIFNLFYDSGCKNFVSRYAAIVKLGCRAMQTRPGPTTIVGVGGMQMQTPHGYYSICLPRRDGTKAFLTGICMDTITETFPIYPLKGEVYNDIQKSFANSGGDVHVLPEVEPEVGGDTDFMVGIKFNRHFPTEVYRCPISGLAIYRSQFKNASGGYGVVGGSHRVFTEIENYHHTNFNWTFHTLQQKINFFRTHLDPDVGMLGIKPHPQVLNYYIDGDVYKNSIQKRLKRFEESEHAGSEIQYRCPDCRDCTNCKRADKTISIKEEIEQDQIERSVSVDIDKGVAIAELPFTADPSVKLSPN